MMNKPLESDYKVYARALLQGTLAGVALALVFGVGFLLRDYIDPPPTQNEAYLLLDEVQVLIDRYYLREQPSYTEREYAAIRGVLGNLGDRNTFFIDPPVARSESQVLAGTYGGIGVNLQRDADGQFILYPFPDSPASLADIRDGDILVAVNGDSLNPSTQQDAIDQMLRGEVKDDNGVDITVLRSKEEISTFIRFDVINVPSVLWRVLAEDGRIGYLQILRFTSRTPDELLIAVEELRTANVEAIILDLRNNSGGLLKESVDVASIFIDEGAVVHERTRDDEQTLAVDEDIETVNLPLVVLVNRGTASASELVSGAIQDHGRGILIGQTTYGKGTIQQIFTLSDASSIHVTAAEWLTPNRNAIDGIGLEPDIMMIPDADGRDIEIKEAIRYLQEELETEIARS
jgi:carboxyl-terminal processing protease